MSWGVNYTYDGYLLRHTINQLDDTLETNKNILDDYWRQLLALAAATPPNHAPSEEGDPYPYEEYLAVRFGKIRREMEDYYRENTHIEDCLETMEESPDKVTEC